MNIQTPASLARDNFRKQIRKKQLQKTFHQHRKLWQIQQNKNDEIQFYKIYGKINENNYHQYLSFMVKYTSNNIYNFMLLSLVGYTYEHLINNPHVEENYLILEVLTQYQEIQIPQTQQFIEILINSLSSRCKIIVNIIANLLQNRKYSSIFRDILIQRDFIQKFKDIFNNLLENGMEMDQAKTIASIFFCICCQFIKTHPILQSSIYKQICQIMSVSLSGQNQKYLLFQALQSIGQNFNPSRQIATILLINFQKLFEKQYYYYQQQILQFEFFCLNSDLKIKKQLKNLIIGSLQNHNEYIRQKVLILLILQIKNYQQYQKQKIYQQNQQNNFLQKIKNLYHISKLQIKYQCLKYLQQFTRCITLDHQDSNTANCFISIISTSLEIYDINCIEKSLEILLKSIHTILIQGKNNNFIINQIYKNNIQTKIYQLRQTKIQLKNIIDQIQQLLNAFQMII